MLLLVFLFLRVAFLQKKGPQQLFGAHDLQNENLVILHPIENPTWWHYDFPVGHPGHFRRASARLRVLLKTFHSFEDLLDNARGS